MRLYEFKLDLNELDTKKREKYEELTEDELLFVLELVEDNGRMTAKEFHRLINSEKDNFTRGGTSLYHAALRMYLIVYNTLPEGTTPNKAWHIIPDKMAEVALQHGHDISDNLSIVRAKSAKKKAHTKETFKQAQDHIRAYWNAHKHHLDPKVGQMRDYLAAQLVKSGHIELVMAPYFTESVLLDYFNRLMECKAKLNILNEGMTAKQFYEIGDMLQDALNKYSAAKRGLGIANKLTNPAEKAMHRSRIMGNMNRLRTLVSKIEQML